MKKTQLKDALRNIIKQKVSYLSVVVIAMLGAASFLSISYASESMKINCSEQYEGMHFRNIEVISTYLITLDDLDALRGIRGVSDVEPVWMAGGEAFHNGKLHKVSFITVSERINTPLIREGSLPQNTTECAVERRLAEDMDWHIGDVIDDFSMTDDSGQFYAGDSSLTITGIVEHPEHLCSNLGEIPYILVLPSVFDHEAMKGACMKAEILIEGLPDKNRFSERNLAMSKAMVQNIEALAKERTPLRDAEVKKQAYEQIDGNDKFFKDSLAEKKELREKLKNDPSATQEEIEETDSAIASFENNLEELKQARVKVDNMAPSRWLVLDDRGSPGFVQLQAGSGNFSQLRMSFALMFFVISAMVIYATVSKMVDEQRTLVGTEKALGFHKSEILGKYLIYGVSGTLIGAAAGVLLARFWLEGIALNGYGRYISVDITRPRFSLGITLIVLLVCVLLSVAAVWSACLNLLRTPAVQLMQPPSPKGRKGTDKRKHLLPLYSRLILRNVRTDWRRAAVMVVSVAGCCSLLVTGFTLKHGVNGCVNKQYGRIVDYDWELECWDYAIPDLEQLLKDSGAEYATVYKTTLITKVEETSIANLLCGDLGQINKVFHLYDWKTGKPITEAEDGILIQRRIAEIYGLDAGSEFELSDGLSSQVTVRVAGVFENYIGLPAAMSRSYYEKTFGKECKYNMILVRVNNADKDGLAKILDEAEGVKFISRGDRSDFGQSSAVINSVIALLTTMSAVLAGVVLMNLTNLFFMQKKSEMTILRINGFSAGKTVGYLLREIAVTTAAGIVLGIAAGSAMAYYILRSLEQSFMQFDRSISFIAWGLGIVITLVFAVIVNWIVLRKIRHLRLSDINE